MCLHDDWETNKSHTSLFASKNLHQVHRKCREDSIWPDIIDESVEADSFSHCSEVMNVSWINHHGMMQFFSSSVGVFRKVLNMRADKTCD